MLERSGPFFDRRILNGVSTAIQSAGCRLSGLALAFLIALLLCPAPAAAQDARCENDKGTAEERVRDCTRIIALGKVKGAELAQIYHYRGHEFFYNLKDHDRALADFSEAIRLNPKGDNSYIRRGEIYHARQDYKRAIADYDQAIRINPKSDEAYASRAASYNELKDYKRGEADIAQALRHNPKNAFAYALRADNHAVRKDHAKAIADYTEALRHDPDYAHVHANVANIHQQMKNYAQALSHANRALQLDDQLEFAYGVRGDIYLGLKDYTNAAADYAKARELKPDNASHLIGLGIVAYRKANYDEAFNLFDQALALDPKNSFAANGRGAVWDRKGNLDRALMDYEEAIRLDPTHALAISNRGEIYLRRDDYIKTLSDANDAIKADPALGRAYSLRGLAQLRMDQRAKALEDIEKGIQVDSDDEFTFYARAEYFMAIKDFARALADYDQALRIDPQHQESQAGRELAVKAGAAARAALASPAASAAPPDVASAGSAASAYKAVAAPGKRVALVMGNAAYVNAPKLDNTIADARIMRDVLKRLGFEVIYGENLDRRAMGRHIGEFGSIVRDAEAAIVYFAGHGSTFSDVPYVVPVDARYDKLADIPSELIQVESMVSELRRARGVRLVILDACRDNEVEVQLKRREAALRGEATRGGGGTRGLARLANPDGLIVVYSTQHLTTAADGVPGQNSPFTEALARNLLTPGMDIKDVLFRAGQEVISRSGGTQRPEISISLYEPFVLAR